MATTSKIWKKEEFTTIFFTLYNIQTALTRKFREPHKKRVTNYTQPKHSRRRRK